MAKRRNGIDTPFTGRYKGSPSPLAGGEQAGVLGPLAQYKQTVGEIRFTTGVKLGGKKGKGIDTPFTDTRNPMYPNTLGRK